MMSGMRDDRHEPSYLHGYTPAEQRRLVEQAEYWRDRLILPDLPYSPGERLLDVGCGAGAVLGVLAAAHPRLVLAGIDREPAQVEAARRHLAACGRDDVDLRVGDAAALPWPDGGFDHAYLMWFVEHVPRIEPILRDIRRVIRAGGTITVNETEYESFHVWPEHDDWEYLEEAMFRHFQAHGQAHAGRRLGPLLVEAGFREVTSRLVGFHFFARPGCDDLRRHTRYTADYIAPAIPAFVSLGCDEARLRRGLGGRQFAALKVGWYYNWAAKTGVVTQVRFVPMIVSGRTVDSDVRGTAVLGFNEPDHEKQSAMSVEQALALWPKVAAKAGLVVSPAVAM